MSEPTITTWRCVKTVVCDDDGDDEICFTEGRLYQGQPGALPDGQPAIVFIDDTEQEHSAGSKWLHEHFVKVFPLEVQ